MNAATVGDPADQLPASPGTHPARAPRILAIPGPWAARPFWLLLVALLVFGLAYRLGVIASPLGELDGDEAVVGLMARHIAYLGERPIFFWGQQYLGSLEAFTAAPLFLLLGSGTALLKLVPTLYSLGFLGLSVLLARRIFGEGPALATGAYLALPPSMWAVWSTKARGGYAEVLLLGEALLLLTLWLGERPGSRRGAAAWGFVAGLALWTHLLAVVYIGPALIYLVARRRGPWSLAEVGLGVLGGLIGAAPMAAYNLTSGFPTVASMLQPSDLPIDPPAQFFRFFRVGVPVLAGLGQPTTSAEMFDHDWPHRPAGSAVIVAALLLVLGATVALQWPAIRRLFGRHSGPNAGPALLVLVAAAVPPVVALTRFGFFVSEPRYALPLYSTVPLATAALWRLPARVRLLLLAAVLAFNVWSLLSTDVRLWRPEEAVDSTTATRADLVRSLVAQDRHQMYTDYWIAYPGMFETRETVLGYVISDGFNRYIPPADNVQRTPNAAWVFIPGSDSEGEFLDHLASIGGTARRQDTAVYHVYVDVTPIDRMRPAG